MWLGKHDAYRPCEQLLEGLPGGYETVIDDQGAPLPPTALIYQGEWTLQYEPGGTLAEVGDVYY